MKTLLFSALCLVVALSSCESGNSSAPNQGGTEKPPPGYDGPVPSARGQAVLGMLEGKTLVDETGAFGGGEWTVTSFAVIPNPVTGKGPVVLLTRDQETRYLPVEYPGDVADLYFRVTGSRTSLLSGEPGENYRKAMRLDE